MSRRKLRRVILIVTVGVVAAAGVGYGAYKYKRSSTYNSLIASANKYIDKGEYDEAISTFKEALQYKNDSTVERDIQFAQGLKEDKANYDQAASLMKDSKYLEAINLFNKVSKNDSTLYSNAQSSIKDCNKKYINMELDNVRTAISDQKFDDAQKYLDDIARVDENNKEAAALKQHLELAKKDKQKTDNASKTLTTQQAIDIVKNRFPDPTPNKTTMYVYDHDSNHDGRQFYVIHVFITMTDHSSTIGWYGVDKQSGRIYDEMNSNYIN